MIYVSLGAGLQSSALLVLSVLGLRDCPRANVAIFADTCDEPRWVYDQLAILQSWAARRGVPVVRTTVGRLADETLTSATPRVAVPMYTRGSDGSVAILPRQCTYEYKIAPIQRWVRRQLGYSPTDRIRPATATALIGISFDERSRIKPSRVQWVVNRWPLIDAVMRRSDCAALLREHGLPVPRKSACVYCPFHDDAYWRDLRTVEPESFEAACQFDEAARVASSRGAAAPVFVHRSLVPLREVTLSGGDQDDFFNDCEGHCGV